jgi:PhzF family phenazine biosynthesis protein
MRIVPFKQVDVFTVVPYRGNPVAVILDGEGLGDAQMQQIAAWTNLSETTFVLPPTQPGADYRVRIFTPRQELSFAGHPSVGTAHAVLEAGWARQHDHQLVMECAAGVLPIAIEGDGAERRIAVQAPPAEIGETDLTLAVGLSKALRATVKQSPSPRPVKVGPWWLVVELEDEGAVRGLAPDMARVVEISRDHDAVGVAAYARCESRDYAIVVRCFAPADGIPEDPVTGSGNACIAAFLRANAMLPDGGATYRASQGREVGRDGYLDMTVTADGRTLIGGHAVTCVDGTIRL